MIEDVAGDKKVEFEEFLKDKGIPEHQCPADCTGRLICRRFWTAESTEMDEMQWNDQGGQF